MNGAPSSAIPSMGSSVPSKTASRCVVKSAISSVTGACGTGEWESFSSEERIPLRPKQLRPPRLPIWRKQAIQLAMEQARAFLLAVPATFQSPATTRRAGESLLRIDFQHRRTISQIGRGIVLSRSASERAGSLVLFQSFPIAVSAEKGSGCEHLEENDATLKISDRASRVCPFACSGTCNPAFQSAPCLRHSRSQRRPRNSESITYARRPCPA